MNNLSDQQKGSLMAFVAVMFLTPDSLFIRLSNVDTWGLVFYRGMIPFVTVFIGMLIIYRSNFFKLLYGNSIYGVAYIVTFFFFFITFVLSIQYTNVANTLVAIAITFLSVLYIFYDSVKLGNIYGDILGFVTSAGLAAGATIIRAGKSLNLVPSAVVGKLVVALVALFFIDSFELKNNDIYIIPAMCILCVAIPFVLVTLAPRYITGAEVNLFFLMETVLGPIWVWMVVKEQPSIETIQGGIVIILTIAIHSFLAIKKTQTKTT